MGGVGSDLGIVLGKLLANGASTRFAACLRKFVGAGHRSREWPPRRLLASCPPAPFGDHSAWTCYAYLKGVPERDLESVLEVVFDVGAEKLTQWCLAD